MEIVLQRRKESPTHTFLPHYPQSVTNSNILHRRVTPCAYLITRLECSVPRLQNITSLTKVGHACRSSALAQNE